MVQSGAFPPCRSDPQDRLFFTKVGAEGADTNLGVIGTVGAKRRPPKNSKMIFGARRKKWTFVSILEGGLNSLDSKFNRVPPLGFLPKSGKGGGA